VVVGGKFGFGQGFKNGPPDFFVGFSVGDFGDLGRGVANKGPVGGGEGEGFHKIGRHI